MVTSKQNQLVKDLRRAFTTGELTEDGHCAVEGFHIVEEALRSGLKLKALFVAQGSEERAKRLLPQISSQTEKVLLPDEVFRSAVSTETPQGVAALVRMRETSLEAILEAGTPLLIAAAGVQDPGNLGTIIRSAEAFGASGVVAIEKTVSPMNSKVIRGSAGSSFRLPVVKTTTPELVRALRENGVRIAATSSHKGTPLAEVDFSQPICVFIGSEGGGVPKEIINAADEGIVIPHSPKVESLNAGIAASILLYEAARQRG